MQPLSRQNLLGVAKELNQVAVAISLMGTRRWKLNQLAREIQPILDELIWVRPEIRKLRSQLVRAIHNMERGPANQRQAKNLRMAARAIEGVAKHLAGGIIPSEVSLGNRRVQNAWGYSSREVMAIIRRMGRVIERLEDAGLSGLTKVDVVINPEESSGQYATYDPSDDAIYVNPDKAAKAEADLYEAFGDRLWLRHFDSGDRQTWGSGASGWNKFTREWVRILDGKGPDRDTAARFAVTVGRVAGLKKWQRAVTGS